MCQNRDLQDCDDAVASFSPSPLIPLPSRERVILSVVLYCCHPPCGYCLEASMTGRVG